MTTSPTDTAPPDEDSQAVEPVVTVPARRRPASGKAAGEPRTATVARGLRTATRRPDVLAALAFVALALWTCGGLFLNPFDRVSAHNPNDHIWFQWLLEHGAYSVRHLDNPLF